MPVDKKCDLTLKVIDYAVDGAAGSKDMLDGNMDLFSYIRQNIAKRIKDFYDISGC